MSIGDLIASVSDRLTPTERRIAEAVLDDPSLLAFGTVSDLAGRVGTSPPSIVRFAAKLGFEGYRDLQSRVQDGLSQQITRPSQRIRHQGATIAPLRAAIESGVAAAFDALDEARLSALAAPLATATNVWIITGETSMAGARAMYSGLSMLRPGVNLVEEQSVGRDLSGAGPDDAAVVIDFHRYRHRSITAARALADAGVPLVAITDGPLSPLVALTDLWCGLSIPGVGPFDSSVPTVIAVELLVARVARELGPAARERLDRLEALWESTGTFLEYSRRGD